MKTFREWLALRLMSHDALIEAVRRREREHCAELIQKLADRWGQTHTDTVRALLEELRKLGSS